MTNADRQALRAALTATAEPKATATERKNRWIALGLAALALLLGLGFLAGVELWLVGLRISG